MNTKLRSYTSISDEDAEKHGFPPRLANSHNSANHRAYQHVSGQNGKDDSCEFVFPFGSIARDYNMSLFSGMRI